MIARPTWCYSDEALALNEHLAAKSPEAWQAIIDIGKMTWKEAKKGFDSGSEAWEAYCSTVAAAVKTWPPEIERKCPNGWPDEFKSAVEHRPRETDLYGHFIAKLATHFDLQLTNNAQAVWLERRFTGGVADIGVVRQAIALLMRNKPVEALRLLQGSIRNIGRVGCADLTGGLTVEVFEWRCDNCNYLAEEGPNPAKQKSTFRCGHCERGGNFIHERTYKHEYRLEIEVKVGDGKQRPEQIARMNSVRARGGCYIVARSIDEAVQEIKKFIESKR